LTSTKFAPPTNTAINTATNTPTNTATAAAASTLGATAAAASTLGATTADATTAASTTAAVCYNDNSKTIFNSSDAIINLNPTTVNTCINLWDNDNKISTNFSFSSYSSSKIPSSSRNTEFTKLQNNSITTISNFNIMNFDKSISLIPNNTVPYSNFQNGYTYEIWFCPKSLQTSYLIYSNMSINGSNAFDSFSTINGYADNFMWPIYELTLYYNGKISINSRNYNTIESNNIGITYEINKWYQIIIVNDVLGDKVSVVVNDGSNKFTKTFNYTATFNNTGFYNIINSSNSGMNEIWFNKNKLSRNPITYFTDPINLYLSTNNPRIQNPSVDTNNFDGYIALFRFYNITNVNKITLYNNFNLFLNAISYSLPAVAPTTPYATSTGTVM